MIGTSRWGRSAQSSRRPQRKLSSRNFRQLAGSPSGLALFHRIANHPLAARLQVEHQADQAPPATPCPQGDKASLASAPKRSLSISPVPLAIASAPAGLPCGRPQRRTRCFAPSSLRAGDVDWGTRAVCRAAGSSSSPLLQHPHLLLSGSCRAAPCTSGLALRRANQLPT